MDPQISRPDFSLELRPQTPPATGMSDQDPRITVPLTAFSLHPCIPSRCHQILKSPSIQTELMPKTGEASSTPPPSSVSSAPVSSQSCHHPPPGRLHHVSAQLTSWLPIPAPIPTILHSSQHRLYHVKQMRTCPFPVPSSGFLHMGEDSTSG